MDLQHIINFTGFSTSICPVNKELLNQGFIETRLRSTLKIFWSLPSFDTPLSYLSDLHR